jgi:AcrR family transcriptional regulator
MRRPRGEPRRLLLDAARTLFARQDYRSTTTREIATAAGVTEHLLFRHFGSKAALFREALVLPFTSFVDEFGRTWQSVNHAEAVEEELTSHFVSQLYDVFVKHQGLLLTLMASEALSEEELAETGIDDVRLALKVLGRISAEGMNLRGMRSDHPDLPAHSTVASDRRRTRAGDSARLPAPQRLTSPAASKGSTQDERHRYSRIVLRPIRSRYRR